MPDFKGSKTQFSISFETGDKTVDEAFGTNFSSLRIINSTRSIWPIFYLCFNLDNQIIIEKNMYGLDDITCKIEFTGNAGEPAPVPIEFKLLYLESNLDLSPKEEENGSVDSIKEPQRRHVIMTCLSKPAYLTLTKFVNKLFEDPDGATGAQLTPLDMIKQMLDDAGIKEYRIIDDGMNEDTVQQMIIPPMTVKSAIDYINQNYAIFQGPMLRYVNYSGQLLLWDLKQMFDKYKDSPFITLHKSPSHFDTPGMFNEINQIAAETQDEFVIYMATVGKVKNSDVYLR